MKNKDIKKIKQGMKKRIEEISGYKYPGKRPVYLKYGIEPDRLKNMAKDIGIAFLKGIRHDTEKPDFTLLPFKALEEVVKAAAFGNTKPGRVKDDWKNIDNPAEDLNPKILRHAIARVNGELKDPESGLNPLAHLAMDALILLWHDPKDGQNK